MSQPAAFITGGSSGIGLELARLLAARGHGLALFARNRNKLESVSDVLREEYSQAEIAVFPVDVGDRAACEDAVAQAIARFGAPGWAIANAGIAEPGLFLDQPAQAHEAHMRTNYLGALYFARAATPHLRQTAGRLVFVASGAALFGIYGYGAYAPSKFAMRGLAEVLRVELAPSGVSVTIAYPPDVDTPMLAAEAEARPPATRMIAAGGGVWQARDVAQVILRRAAAGKFTAAPGLQMKALLALHSAAGPLLRTWQGWVVRRAGPR